MNVKYIFILSLNLLYSINSLKYENIDKIKEKYYTNNYFFNNEVLKNDEDLIEISDYERINPKNPNFFYIPIIGSSDIHGHFYPEEIENGNISYSRGGLDYLAKYINIIRDEFENKILYFDAGDLFHGGVESTITNGEIILDYFNLIKLDGIVFGNHEYDLDRKHLEQDVKNAKFPFLTTNVYDTIKKTKKAFGENHITSKIYTFIPNNKNEEKVKIGVIGLTHRKDINKITGQGYENILFLDYREELVSEANKLRKENNVNAIILLSHIGCECGIGNNLVLNMYRPSDIQEACDKDLDLYKLINSIESGVIDAVVTGHSHREVHHFINGIPVISPVNNGLYANIIYLAFDRKNNYKIVKDEIRIEGPLPICEKIFKKNHKCEFIKLNEIDDYLPLIDYKFHNVKIQKDPILQPIHDKYDEIYQNYSEKICSIEGIEETLTIETNGSCYLGNLIADIQKSITGAEISIVSYGNLKAEWNPGRIPLHKVRDLIPYKNYLCTFNMNGNEIKKMMKIIQRGSKKYYFTSGLKQIFIKHKDGEYYLHNLKLFDGVNELNLKPEKEYLVNTNSYLIQRGGNDFPKVLSWYKPRNLNCSYGVDIELIEKYLRDQQIIDIRKYMDIKNPRIRFIE